VHFVSEFAICSAPSQRTDKAGESDVLTSTLWCTAAHRSIGPKYGGERALRKSIFTATLKCEVKGKKEGEENERKILLSLILFTFFKNRRDVNY